jgi:spermidine synthase
VDRLGLVLACVLLLLALTILSQTKPRLGDAFSAAALSALAIAATRIQPDWRGFYLKNVYWRPHFSSINNVERDLNLLKRLGRVERTRSKYQWIDLLDPRFSAGVQGSNPFMLFLNRHLQFNADSFQRYHESMVQGAFNLLAQPPRKALILGGGDGLLLPELFKSQSLTRVDLVELDKAMIDLAKNEPRLLQMNQDAFADPRVHVHIEDAFRYVRGDQDKFDLILIDLPYPESYDLSLLFTREFYALVKKRLNERALMIMDFPPPERSSRSFDVILNTLKAAGFDNLWAFGAEETFLVAANDSRQKLEFDFDELAPRVQNRTLSNLISRAQSVNRSLTRASPINSVFFPILFEDLKDKP